MKKKVWGILLSLTLIILTSFTAFANDEKFVGGIGGEEFEEALNTEGIITYIIDANGNTANLTTTSPTALLAAINPPSPITNRLIDSLGLYPDYRGLDVYNNKIYVKMIETGGYGQYYNFTLKRVIYKSGVTVTYNENIQGVNPSRRTAISGTTNQTYIHFVTSLPAADYDLIDNLYFNLDAWWGKPWGAGLPEPFMMGARIDFP
jgi:hypothetical protein